MTRVDLGLSPTTRRSPRLTRRKGPRTSQRSGQGCLL
jgi:hypothetical protein